MDKGVKTYQAPHLGRVLFTFLVGATVLIASVGCGASRSASAQTNPTPVVASASGTDQGVGVIPTPTPVPAAPTPTTVPAIPAATDLAQRDASGKALPSGGWSIGSLAVAFRAPAVVGQALIPQVEVAKVGQAYTGQPTAQGTVISPTGQWVNAQIDLKGLGPGQYTWQARFVDSETKRAGNWVAFADGKGGFGVVGQPPTIQGASVTGATASIKGVSLIGAKGSATVHWTAQANPSSALARIAYVVSQQATAPKDAPANATALAPSATSLPLDKLGDGAWYVHLWAQDQAGQTSPPATVAVEVERAAPVIGNVLYRTWATNPEYQKLPINFTVSQPSSVDVTIFPAASTTPIRAFRLGSQAANHQIQINWDGKDAKGQIVAPGAYRFMVTAVDDAGNQGQGMYSGLTIINKVIKVSLKNESMTAYEGSKVFVTTLVTTGGQELPTPTGQYEIIEKAAPFVFHAQYPKGSPFWFPDVKSNFAMLFYQQGADFIHDAPWRSIYGPGTNGPGIPGQARTGSHGCVETPHAAMVKLYPWTPMGTPVIVTQ